VNKLTQVRRETKTKNACKDRPPTHLLLSSLHWKPRQVQGVNVYFKRIRYPLLVTITYNYSFTCVQTGRRTDGRSCFNGLSKGMQVRLKTKRLKENVSNKEEKKKREKIA
jgi:hypothetical protein